MIKLKEILKEDNSKATESAITRFKDSGDRNYNVTMDDKDYRVITNGKRVEAITRNGYNVYEQPIREMITKHYLTKIYPHLYGI